MNIWQGTSDNFSNPANWTDGVPTADDILVFSGMVPSFVTETPPLGEGPPSPPPPSPPPPPFSNVSVTFPDVSDTDYEAAYAGIRILNGYGGTITFPTDQGFGEWTQNSGVTHQAADTTISVTSTFGWVGGAINATSNTATMKLSGVTNGQVGEDHTTLSSGSKIVLDKNAANTGSYVRQSGILTQNNDSVVEVLDASIFEQERLNAPPSSNTPTVGKVVVKAGGKAYDKGGKADSVHLDGGVLVVKDFGMEVTDKVPGKDWGVYVENSGLVEMMDGVTLTATFGVYLKKGSLWNTPSVDTLGVSEVHIDGEFRIDDGLVILGKADTFNPKYGSLIVHGDAKLWGGKFSPKVDMNNAGNRDFIESKKKLNFHTDFVLDPSAAGVGTSTGPWLVLRSADGIADQDNPTDGSNVFDCARTDDDKDIKVTMQ